MSAAEIKRRRLAMSAARESMMWAALIVAEDAAAGWTLNVEHFKARQDEWRAAEASYLAACDERERETAARIAARVA